MTKKTALQIAYNILSDELDAIEHDYGDEAADDSYHEEVAEAMAVIKKMLRELA